MEKFTKANENHLVIKILAFLPLPILLYLGLRGINLKVSPEIYQLIHIFMETMINIAAASIFLLLYYTYPYASKIKYVVPGSIFLILVFTNILHIYYSMIDNDVMRAVSSNLVHFILSTILFFFAILPEKPLGKNKHFISIIPLVIIIVSLIFSKSNISFYMKFFASSPGSYSQNIPSIIASAALYIFSLIRFSREYKKSRSIEYSSLINSIICMTYALVLLLLIKYPSDMYSILSQIFKLSGIILIFKAYFINTIKRIYDGLNDARNLAEEENNIKTDFIVNLSHELRTPINIILNALKFVNAKDKQSSHIKSIENNALRLNKVCQNIIMYSEIENGITEVNLSAVDVVYMIDEILEEADKIADEKGLEIIFEFKNNSIISTDSEKLKTIILNLISNAIKYVPSGGIISINLDIGDNLELRVMNNGPLIRDEDRFRIFDKFYKSSDNRLCSREGLGIGLYISKIYSELLNGSIEILNSNDFTGYKLIIPIKKHSGKPEVIQPYNIRGYFADIS